MIAIAKIIKGNTANKLIGTIRSTRLTSVTTPIKKKNPGICQDALLFQCSLQLRRSTAFLFSTGVQFFSEKLRNRKLYRRHQTWRVDRCRRVSCRPCVASYGLLIQRKNCTLLTGSAARCWAHPWRERSLAGHSWEWRCTETRAMMMPRYWSTFPWIPE